jgi:hypothetical protein
MLTKILIGGLGLAAFLTLMPERSQATCAWVLWSSVNNYTSAPGEKSLFLPWAIFQAMPTMEDCMRLLEFRVNNPMAVLPGDQVTTDIHGTKGTVIVSKQSAVWTSRYLCLPDTVDPREPSRP